MAKFSEFMQHSRIIAQLITGSQADADLASAGETGEDSTGENSTAQADTAPTDITATQRAITQDEIVSHLVTASSLPPKPKRADDAPSRIANLIPPPESDRAVSDTATAEVVPDDVQPEIVTRGVEPVLVQVASPENVDQLAAADNPEDESSDTDDEAGQYPDTVWEDALQSLPRVQRPLQRLLPMTARVGVLSLVAVAMWWTWPRNDDTNLWVNDARAGDVQSFAVVNPANVEPAGAIARAATPSTAPSNTPEQFNNIVIVTPTSANDAQAASNGSDNTALSEPIVLEASGLVTDADTGAIIIEIPEAVPPDALVPALQDETATAEQMEIVLIPTATPTPQSVGMVDTSAIPKVEIVPAVGAKTTATTEAPTPTSTPTEVPTATPPPIGPGRLWSTFAPLPPTTSDHFWIGNPFDGISANRYSSPSYQFGSTGGNRYRPHHGLDFSNPVGTPVKAAVTGTVVHAGPDDPDILGPYPNFYGNAVVIRLDQQLPVVGGQLDVFVLYGHLSEVRAEVGQHVEPSDIVGLVGMTGIAIGPHLHVEARLGANTYDHSVNPYLWLQPDPGNGAVAVRILTAKGRTWAGAKVSIARFESGRAVWGRQIETYLDTENIGPDPLWGENGAMGDVPAGSYYLIATINGESIRSEFTVNPGETTFVEIRTEQ